MIIGIDAGGTNVDAVLLDEGIVASSKVTAGDDDVAPALERLLEGRSSEAVDRVVVATTRVLNDAVQDRLPGCTNVVIPGPGLSPERAFYGEENHVAAGCIDHRGRITEPTAYDGTPGEEVVAVTAKFSPRNPDPERRVDEALDATNVALGHASGAGLTFPTRAATTVANAKAGPTFADVCDGAEAACAAAGIDAPIYYLTGDAAMLSADAVRPVPAQTLRCGAAASALGLIALSGVDRGICVDVGGTTTDVVPVREGFPAIKRGVDEGGLETGYDAVTARALSLGGDTRVADGDGELTGRREDDAAAFGGEYPTLTDALHVLEEYAEGDEAAARSALDRVGDPERVASSVVEAYVDRVANEIEALDASTSRLIVGGALAAALADRIAVAPGVGEVLVPAGAPVAGAVGCAVARVSVETAVHIDTARGVLTVTAVGPESVEEVERGRTFDDEEIRDLAAERARGAAVEAGGEAGHPVEVTSQRAFNVVERSRIVGQIVDATARVEPGLRSVDVDDDGGGWR